MYDDNDDILTDFSFIDEISIQQDQVGSEIGEITAQMKASRLQSIPGVYETKRLGRTSDIRPRVAGKLSNKSILIDSGAMVTAWPHV